MIVRTWSRTAPGTAGDGRSTGGPGGARHHASRRLRLAGTVLPAVAVVLLQLLLWSVVAGEALAPPVRGAVAVSVVAVSVLAVLVFARAMFRVIDEEQERVARNNRALLGLHEVARAAQSAGDVHAVLETTVPVILRTTSAVAARVVVAATGPEDDQVFGVVDTAEGQGESVDVPLAVARGSVGWIRLTFGEGDDTRPDPQLLNDLAWLLGGGIASAQTVTDLRRRRREDLAVRDLLVQITNRDAPADILGGVVHHARELLPCDEAVVALNADASAALGLAEQRTGEPTLDDGTRCIASEADDFHNVHGRGVVCPIRASAEWRTVLTVPIRGEAGGIGDIWVARRTDEPFTAEDRSLVQSLADLTAIALRSWSARDGERYEATVAERERIAREMHDSLAQVLGATHLRLRALEGRAEGRGWRDFSHEVSDLADVCADAYADVREAILGLRESSRTDRDMLSRLRFYLETYARQSGIDASLECEAAAPLQLTPQAEVHVLRVIQEALTNVRKHARADRVLVRIREVEGGLEFSVSDDGCGFDPATTRFGHDGYGLHTMRERMSLLHGRLAVDSQPSGGTRVTAHVPVPGASRPVLVEIAGGSRA